MVVVASSASTSKQYSLTATSISRCKASLKAQNFQGPDFECTFSFMIKDLGSKRKQKHSVVLQSVSTSSSETSSVIGIGDIDLVAVSAPIHICFGDPDLPPADIQEETPSASVVWESMRCQDRAKLRGYELSIDLGPSIGRKTFIWKRTHVGEHIGPVAKKLDFLNLKMEDIETGRVVARFAHHPWVGWKRGQFEIVEDGGYGDSERWVEIVLLSGLTMLEYMRKVGGWSL